MARALRRRLVDRAHNQNLLSLLEAQNASALLAGELSAYGVASSDLSSKSYGNENLYMWISEPAQENRCKKTWELRAGTCGRLRKKCCVPPSYPTVVLGRRGQLRE